MWSHIACYIGNNKGTDQTTWSVLLLFTYNSQVFSRRGSYGGGRNLTKIKNKKIMHWKAWNQSYSFSLSLLHLEWTHSECNRAKQLKWEITLNILPCMLSQQHSVGSFLPFILSHKNTLGVSNFFSSYISGKFWAICLLSSGLLLPFANSLDLVWKSDKPSPQKNSCRNTISVKQFGSRSGQMFCRAWSGSKLFAKVISRWL